MRLDPNLALARYGVGEANLALGRPAAALALGNAYFQTGALTEAEREFRQALAALPDWGDAHHNLAVVLLATGRLDEAQEEADRAEAAGVAVHPRLREELQRKRAETNAAHP